MFFTLLFRTKTNFYFYDPWFTSHSFNTELSLIYYVFIFTEKTQGLQTPAGNHTYLIYLFKYNDSFENLAIKILIASFTKSFHYCQNKIILFSNYIFFTVHYYTFSDARLLSQFPFLPIPCHLHPVHSLSSPYIMDPSFK